jgi:putative endonuclease
MTDAPVWSVYLVRCDDGSLYTGISTDVPRRLKQHQSNRGAKRLRGQQSLRLVYAREVGDRATAQRIEYRVKCLKRDQKEDLVAGRLDLPLE